MEQQSANPANITVQARTSPWQVAITATNIAKEILGDGKDPDSSRRSNDDRGCLRYKDNVDERYEYGF